MPSKRYAPLSAVLSWIAFGEWTDADTHWDCYAQAKSQLEDAMARFSDTASDGLIFVRGNPYPTGLLPQALLWVLRLTPETRDRRPLA